MQICPHSTLQVQIAEVNIIRSDLISFFQYLIFVHMLLLCLFGILLGYELVELGVGPEQLVPPDEGGGVVALEVHVVEVMESST